MAAKLKCGSTLESITSISLARLPERISLSLAMRSTTSRVTFFTSVSGARSCAGAAPASTSPAAAASRLASRLAGFILVAFIVWLPFPGRVPIVDQAAAPLQIGIPLKNVLVERRFLEDAARVEQVGARLREAQAPQRVLRMVRANFAERIGVDVGAGADAVAQIARAEERQHQIRARARPPVAQGLAEILVVLLVSHVARDVVDAEQADSGIKRNTRPVVGTVGELALQEIVHADEHVGDVAEEVAHPVADLAGHHLAIRGGHWLRHRLVHLVVEAVDDAVHAFQRIARIALARGRAAGEQCDGERQPGSHFGASFASGLGSALASGFASAALLNRNWLIRFSSTTADCVSRSRSPFFSITPSPPASRPTYCSPRMPEVSTLAVVSRGNW